MAALGILEADLDESFVRPVCRCGTMPRRPVRVVTERAGECPVCLTPLRAGGRLVHRRTDQRMLDRYDVTLHAQQTGLLGLHPGPSLDPAVAGGLPQDRDPSGVVCGRHQQQRLYLLW